MDLHTGKLTEECKTTVPFAFTEYIRELAIAAKCHPSDIVRELLFKAATGKVYSAHVANDRLRLIETQGRLLGEMGASE
jgi:hypothetical protein